VILIYNRSTNWLLYFMLHLNIMVSFSVNAGTCDVMKWQLNCSLVVLFSTLQYQVTILQYQLTHSCLVMVLLCLIYVRYVFGLGGININPSNAKLNPICHLLALLGAHHIVHISRIMVKETNMLRQTKNCVCVCV
jgi:hypothetical protein